MKTVRKIIGSQGEWTVEVTYVDGSKETLPTAHKAFTKFSKGNASYSRDWEAVSSGRKRHEYLELLGKAKRVVLTNDEINGLTVKRKDYIGVYEIDDVAFDNDRLSYRFTARLPEVLV